MEWILGVSGAGSLALIAWLVYKLVKRDDQLLNAHDSMASLNALLTSSESAREVAEARLKTEMDLRAIAEAQRNEAQRKARAYLAQNLAHASDKEIQDAVTEMFATPLSLAPDTALKRP